VNVIGSEPLAPLSTRPGVEVHSIEASRPWL
jgi:hypothetical protein